MAKAKLLKSKKKKWLQIVAPKLFNNQVLGESYVASSDKLIGKQVKYNLMNLIRKPSNSSINLSFVVDTIKEDKGMTKLVGYEMVPSSVKRMVKRGKNKVELSFSCLTSDDVQIRIKPLVITKSITTGVVLASLRRGIVDELVASIGKLNFDELMKQLISNQLQISLKKKLKTIYPIRGVVVRSAKIEKKTKKTEAKVIKKKPAEKKQEKAEIVEEKKPAKKPISKE